MKKESVLRMLLVAFLSAIFVSFVGCKEEDGPNEPAGTIDVLSNKLNTNLASLQEVIAKLDGKDYATKIEPLTENGSVAGYSVVFANSNLVVIYDGLNGLIPMISLKAEEGQYYWTLNGEWLTDGQGAKYAVADALPKTKVAGDKWSLSWDGGKSWTEIGAASSESQFMIAQNEMWVLLTVNGEIVSVPKSAELACQFAIVAEELTSSAATVTVTPSNDKVHYYWGVYPATATEEEIKAELQYDIDYYVASGLSVVGYWKKYSVQGVSSDRISNLMPETTYQVIAVAINMTTGDYASDFTTAEFTTNERKIDEAVSLTIKCEAYFDGDEIYEVGNSSGYAYYKGRGYASFTVVTEGAPAHYYWALTAIGDDFDSISDDSIISTLIDPNQISVRKDMESYGYAIDWGLKYAMVGVAEDINGNFGKVFREKITFDKAGCSDISLLFPEEGGEEESVSPQFIFPIMDNANMQRALTWTK